MRTFDPRTHTHARARTHTNTHVQTWWLHCGLPLFLMAIPLMTSFASDINIDLCNRTKWNMLSQNGNQWEAVIDVQFPRSVERFPWFVGFSIIVAFTGPGWVNYKGHLGPDYGNSKLVLALKHGGLLTALVCHWSRTQTNLAGLIRDEFTSSLKGTRILCKNDQKVKNDKCGSSVISQSTRINLNLKV